jgi:YVTN family beta-propeller protein
MQANKSDRMQRGHSFIKILGIAVLAVVMLMSIAGAAPFAYITNSGSNTVSVIDTATNKVTATVKVGYDPYGIAISPDGKKAYVTNSGNFSVPGNTVSVIDTATNRVTATVKIGNNSYGVATSPDGKKVYVTSEDGVSVINTITSTVTATIKGSSDGTIGVYGLIAVAMGGSKVYAENDAVSLGIIDAATNNVSSTVDVGGTFPNGIAVNKDGTKLYVSTGGAADAGYGVSIIDTATNSYIGDVALPIKDPMYRPSDVAVNPADTKVYTTWSDGTVSVTDVERNTVIASVPVGDFPEGIAVSPDGKQVYVTNSGNSDVPGNTISVIDTTTNKVTATVKVGSDPSGVAIESV